MVLLGRKGYFFVIDAIIAASIVLFGLLYLFGSSVTVTDQTQTYRSTEDFASILLNTPLSLSQNAYYKNKLLAQNLVPYPDSTPLEEIGYLWYSNPAVCPECISHAQNFTESMMNESLENRYGGAVYIGGVLVYGRTNAQQVTMINRSVILYVRMNATNLIGPVRGDVIVWY